MSKDNSAGLKVVVDPNMITILEEALSAAKRGKMKGFVLVAESDEEQVYSVQWTYGTDKFRLIGMFEMLKRNILVHIE